MGDVAKLDVLLAEAVLLVVDAEVLGEEVEVDGSLVDDELVVDAAVLELESLLEFLVVMKVLEVLLDVFEDLEVTFEVVVDVFLVVVVDLAFVDVLVVVLEGHC